MRDLARLQLKNIFDALNDYGSVLVKLVISIGVVVVFSYCAFSINFFPKGLTLGDSLVFIFIALGFGVFYLFWLSLGYFVIYCISYPFSEKIGKGDSFWEKIYVVIVGIILFMILSLFYRHTGDLRSVIAPLGSGVIILLVTYFWNSSADGLAEELVEKREKVRVGVIILALFVAPLVGVSTISKIVDSSFRVFGINQNNVSLVLDEKNFNIVSGVAKGLDLPLFGCELGNERTRIVHNVSVLWHGVGDRSLIALLKQGEDGLKSAAKLELDSEGTNIVKPFGNQSTLNACINLESDTLFESYESAPSDHGTYRLELFVNKIKNYLEATNLEISSASITGYTDRTAIVSKDDTNYALSLRRAKSVYNTLSPLFSEDVRRLVRVSGKGASNPKSNCDEGLEPMVLNECLAIDRRVEIEFQFKHVKKD